MHPVHHPVAGTHAIVMLQRLEDRGLEWRHEGVSFCLMLHNISRLKGTESTQFIKPEEIPRYFVWNIVQVSTITSITMCLGVELMV